MSERKNSSKETSTSLTRIAFLQCEVNLMWIIGWNFQNFVFNSISTWLFNSFQTFVQIKTKLLWMEMKKPPDNSALTVCSNVIHTNVNIYFRIYNEQKWRDFLFILLVCLWFYKQIVFNPFSINKSLGFHQI